MKWPRLPGWRLPAWGWRLSAWMVATRLRIAAVAVAGLLALFVLVLAIFSAVELSRFERVETRRATYVYAGPQPLIAGVQE